MKEKTRKGALMVIVSVGTAGSQTKTRRKSASEPEERRKEDGVRESFVQWPMKRPLSGNCNAHSWLRNFKAKSERQERGITLGTRSFKGDSKRRF